VQHLHSLQQLLRRQSTQALHHVIGLCQGSWTVPRLVRPRGPARRCMTPPGCRRTRRVSRRVNGPLLGDDPAVRVSVHTAAMATAGIGSAVGRGRHLVRGTPRRVPAEDHAAGNSSWCVMRGRTRFVREEAIRRGVLETGRTSSNASSTSLSLPEPRAFASQPPAPGWAAVQPARIADLGVPTPPREGVNAARPTTATPGEGCPGSTSGSGVYQQLYLQRRPARCLKPHRLTPFRVTNDVTRARCTPRTSV
jgi:hypothetical protein